MKGTLALVAVACSSVLASGLAILGAGGATARAAAGECGLPASSPVWIDYAEGTVGADVRAVFARPGVVVASSGTAIPKSFRDHGAATTYFELKLPAFVGEPSDPADPASIPPAAAKLDAQAVASTGCATPVIALNELLGSGLKTPWSASNTTYRADVLGLMQQLQALGAHPALFVHGNFDLSGDAASWWRQVGQAGQIVYELYYDASHIYALGPVVGNRRMRMGGRSLVDQFGAIGVAPDRLGIALGFHSSSVAGVAGRQGLEPREAWLRVVKWEALAARQVAQETGVAYRHDALSAVFARVALRSAALVPLSDVLAVEQQAIGRSFHGDRRGYLEALTRAHATLGVARGIIRDELRRRALAAMLSAQGSTQTTLDWTATREAAAVDTAICLHDDLPGAGGFPQTDAREVGLVPLLARLPFLFADKTPPAAPGAPTAARSGAAVVLTWTPDPEADLSGYEVFRASSSGGPYQQVGPFLDRPSFVDTTAPPGVPSFYVVRAVDTSRNTSDQSAEATVS
jgi:hypothetical protein